MQPKSNFTLPSADLERFNLAQTAARPSSAVIESISCTLQPTSHLPSLGPSKMVRTARHLGCDRDGRRSAKMEVSTQLARANEPLERNNNDSASSANLLYGPMDCHTALRFTCSLFGK